MLGLRTSVGAVASIGPRDADVGHRLFLSRSRHSVCRSRIHLVTPRRGPSIPASLDGRPVQLPMGMEKPLSLRQRRSHVQLTDTRTSMTFFNRVHINA